MILSNGNNVNGPSLVSTSSSVSIWDELVQNMRQNGGVASLSLSSIIPENDNSSMDWAHFFAISRHSMNRCKQLKRSQTQTKIPFITSMNDSAHITGWHFAGCESHDNNDTDEKNDSLSRYNEYREGFIFSDGELFDLDMEFNIEDHNVEKTENSNDNSNIDKHQPQQSDIINRKNNQDFRTNMEEAFTYLHDTIANEVLKAIAKDMCIDENWFQANLGPTKNSSQWHVKRYVHSSSNVNNDLQYHIQNKNSNLNANPDLEREILPMHTDPSLISIVIHDRPGIHSGGLGLQYLSPASNTNDDTKMKKIWKNVPAHGHSVATIFIGSVLSLLTGGMYPAACHRVIEELNNSNHNNINTENIKHSTELTNERMAVTLFVRPYGKSMLQVPPSPKLLVENEKGEPSKLEYRVKVKQMTFDAWNSKVARNYMKKKKKNKNIQEKSLKNKSPSSMNDFEYFRDEYTELSIIAASPPLTGREKYLGGELGNNNIVYTIPGHAKRVLAIDPDSRQITPIGPEFHGEYKWLRAVKIPSTGVIYGIPCHANCILKIIPEQTRVSTFGSEVIGTEKNQLWKWHGGVLSPHDGCIYCIPQFAEKVLKIDPNNNDAVSLIGPRLCGRNKWYGGLLGKSDGAIYGIPQNAKGILRIDPKTQEVTVHGDFGLGGYKWHGGVIEKKDGIIYGIPAHADRVLKITPGLKPSMELIGNKLRSGIHRIDGKYKFLGGVCGHDGKVYFFPSDTDYVVQVNCETNEVKEIGPSLVTLERIRQNKWQNGFIAPDGVIYGIPLKSETILRIRPRGKDEDPEITTIGGPYKGLNKWEGGVMANDGSMYCMPLNHRGVLCMKPLSS